MNSKAAAADFRIDNAVYLGESKEPLCRSTTIFHKGVVYDCMKTPSETIVFDMSAGRFILLNLKNRTRAELTTGEVASFADRLQEVAARSPERIHTVHLDPGLGLMPYQVRGVGFALGLRVEQIEKLDAFLSGLYKLFVEKDASLAEINPLVITGQGDLLALDCKLGFDDGALYRHPDIRELRDPDEEDPREREAREIDLAYVGLDGDIGCMVNGAGLAMATLDMIHLCGGTPANFLDVGGGADKDKITGAFKLILRDPNVRAILVNIFGGIVRCDLIAEGVVAAAQELSLEVPLVVRLQGTRAEEGRSLLAGSALDITPADTLQEAGERVVAAASGTS